MRHGCGVVGECVPDRLLDVCMNFQVVRCVCEFSCGNGRRDGNG